MTHKKRIEKAKTLFLSSIPLMVEHSKKSKRQNELFYWSQIVIQEYVMWSMIGEKVSIENFNLICDRRGLDNIQKDFMAYTLIEMDLF
jgi:hypothetical protein